MKYIKIIIISIILISNSSCWQFNSDEIIYDCRDGSLGCKVYRKFAVPFETDLDNIFIPPPNTSNILEAYESNPIIILRTREGDFIYERNKLRQFIPKNASDENVKIAIFHKPHKSDSFQISSNWNTLITLLTSLLLLK